MKIAVLTPSRSRPKQLTEFVDSVHSLALDSDRIFTYNYIDIDDPNLSQYYEMKSHQNNYNYYGLPLSVSKSWNIIADMAIENGADVLIMGNDDARYRTPYWDILLEREIEKYPDQIYCMWFEDLINGPNHCAFPIVSRKWYKTLGYFTPGIFHFGYNDTWIFDIAKRINRTHFIPHIVNEHLHFTTGKSVADETTHRNRTQEAGNLYAKDRIIFEQTKAERELAAEALENLMI